MKKKCKEKSSYSTSKSIKKRGYKSKGRFKDKTTAEREHMFTGTFSFAQEMEESTANGIYRDPATSSSAATTGAVVGASTSDANLEEEQVCEGYETDEMKSIHYEDLDNERIRNQGRENQEKEAGLYMLKTVHAELYMLGYAEGSMLDCTCWVMLKAACWIVHAELDEFDVPGDKIDVTRDELDVTRDEFDVTRDDFDVTREEFDVPRVELDVTRDEFDVTRDEFDVTRDEFDVTRDEFDVTRDEFDAGESRLDSGDGNRNLFPGMRLPPNINAVNPRCLVAQQYLVNYTLTPLTAWARAPPPMQYQAEPFYYLASPAYPSPRIPRPFVHNYAPAHPQAFPNRPPALGAPLPAQQALPPRHQQMGQTRPRTQHPPLLAPRPRIYHQLLAVGKITPEAPHPKFNPANQDQNLRCEYYIGAPGYTTKNCRIVWSKLQKMIEAREFSSNNHWPLNVQVNPLPDHASSSRPTINLVDICARGEDEDMEEEPTSA
ncbi:hypothetical protein CRG98_010745 [Punica granatum]|uniref:Uncharacterized protein n=1 Tax=Punica granatum TaxID=22663 RepID=A0A2I0KKP8_PUNGR|nr:hypothetical protein CRG98_010745 [Punica granatum]